MVLPWGLVQEHWEVNGRVPIRHVEVDPEELVTRSVVKSSVFDGDYLVSGWSLKDTKKVKRIDDRACLINDDFLMLIANAREAGSALGLCFIHVVSIKGGMCRGAWHVGADVTCSVVRLSLSPVMYVAVPCVIHPWVNVVLCHVTEV